MAKRIIIWVAFVGLTYSGLAMGTTSVQSSLFPLCWGGSENQQLYFTCGEVQRLLILYRNDGTGDATNVQFRIDLPQGSSVVYACNYMGYSLPAKTAYTTNNITRNGDSYVRVTLPMYNIPAGFKPMGDSVSAWSRWPGWYTYLMIKGGTVPKPYHVYWQLSSTQSTEPEQTAVANLLPPLPPVTLPGQMRVGFWMGMPLLYLHVAEAEDQVIDTLAAAGVGKVIVQNGIGTRAVNSMHRYANMLAFIQSFWSYLVFAASEPIAEARAVNEQLQSIPGISWCPEYVRHGMDNTTNDYYTKLLSDVKNSVQSCGADGFILDYEGASAQGYDPCNICFCVRCRSAFESYMGSSVANWPADVRPGGYLNNTWLTFRNQQDADYVKVIADAARSGNPNALTETWSGGYYQPYPTHTIYSQYCTDITRFAPYLTNVTVGTYTYPTDSVAQLTPTPGFGTDPANWGVTLTDMMKVVSDTVQHISAATGVIPCGGAAHELGDSATPLSSVSLLRFEALNCLYDGARGFDFWGLGPIEDGRYLELMNELARTFHAVENYILTGQPSTAPVVNPPSAILSKAWTLGGSTLVMLLNTSYSTSSTVTVSVPAGNQATDPVNYNSSYPVKNSAVTIPIIPLHARFVLLHTGS